MIPRLAEGTELIGEYQGSGFREPKYIVRRADGQVAQLSQLLYVLAAHLDGRRDHDALAAAVGRELDRELTPEQVSFLLEEKLRPPGIVAPAVTDAPRGAAPESPTRPDPLLMLRYRLPVIPPRVVNAVAGLLRPMYWPPVVAVMLTSFLALDGVVIARGGLGQMFPAAEALVSRPGLTLLVLGVILVAGMIHEWGHVTACRYGGAEPGVMGFGIYVVWPALYSTVTDAYRLGRGGRLRTDLGGVYFNAVVMAAMAGAYLGTGSGWILVALALWHFETLWQFLPSIRLDGYYILADLVGVPDLFSRLGPVIAGLWPGRPTPREVLELKPWTRRVITVWVLLVVPTLLAWLTVFLIMLPALVPALVSALRQMVAATVAAFEAGQVTTGCLGVVQVLLLLLPPAGIGLIAATFARQAVRAARRRWGPFRLRRRVHRAPALVGGTLVAAGALLGAAAMAGVVTLGPGPLLRSAPPPAVTPAPPPVGLTVIGRVVAVQDAQTVTVSIAGQDATVSVLGLEAPTGCGRDAALDFAEDTLDGQTVTLVPDPTIPPVDDQGRRLAYVVLPSELSYTDAALLGGYAARSTARPLWYDPVFVREQRDAQRARAGIWGAPCRG
ncbi:hypothetical protein LQ327_01380 [Actinomycetospora endophytica]|uniref:TNase-like domain-containing protein n=1 Tax=Actinomycetospora endophytica TaxID=2291215 RepID=A0ABS8P1A9_9PSEU|nr:hypothetical protein [Actinomycetospora endophytica]MCD2192042.1 hypothetical protein [Actinomycetospora endophytica]